jgi:hypothetical protein
MWGGWGGSRKEGGRERRGKGEESVLALSIMRSIYACCMSICGLMF